VFTCSHDACVCVCVCACMHARTSVVPVFRTGTKIISCFNSNSSSRNWNNNLAFLKGTIKKFYVILELILESQPYSFCLYSFFETTD